MTYTNTLSIVRTSGIGVEVQNELLGTGDSSNKSFDLDNGNVIASSYTVKYGAASGNDVNDLTTLTETTHYTLEKDSGTLLLTASGVSTLATNKLYISYTHSPKASDTWLNTFIAAATKEVDNATGNYWGSQTSNTEQFDWDDEERYPTTDAPYIMDYDSPSELKLKYRGIISIIGAYVLGHGIILSSAQRYDSNADSYTDVKDNANNTGSASFQPFADTTAADDYLYIGAAHKFLAVNILMYRLGVTGGDNTVEYYDGSSWTAFTPTESTTGVLNFEANGKLSWSSLSNWTKTTVNGSVSAYFIRIKAASTYSTEALINTIYVDQDSAIIRDIPISQLRWTSEGRVVFYTKLPNGSNNIRIDYLHGYSSVPADVQELTDLYCSLRVFAAITGGSYDDATSFTLGRKTVSIGEVYVNVREASRQFQVRIENLLQRIGATAVAVA